MKSTAIERFLLFALALTLVQGAASEWRAQAKSALTPFEKALGQERTQDLAGAYKTLADPKASLSDAQKLHLLRLHALWSFENLSKYGPPGVSAEGARDLQNLIEKLDPVQDEALLQNAYPILDKLESSAKSLDASDLANFVRERNRALPLIIRQLPMSLTHAAGCAIAILTIAILLIWRRWPRKGVQMSFEDLSQGVGDQAEKDRSPKDRLLMQKIQQAFWVPRTELSEDSLEDLQFDALGYRDGYGFGTLAPRQPLIPWGELVASETPIKIGPVAFNLKQLISVLTSPLQIRRKDSLVGFLHDDGKQQILVAQRINRKGQPVAGHSWKAELKSGEDRTELIRDLAAQVIVEWPVSEVTNNWRSYRKFEEGLQLLSRQRGNGGSRQCMQQISHNFEMALSYDPANWMARFYLGIALRRRGDYERAADHLQVLETLLVQANYQLPFISRFPLINRLPWINRTFGFGNPVVQHLFRYPQCAFLVLYNRAMALSGSHEACKIQQALKILDRIIAMKKGRTASKNDLNLRKCAGLLKREDRKRFVMLAQSAKSAVLAAQLEIEARNQPGDPVTSKIRHEIRSLYTTVTSYQQCLKPDMLTSHTLALAITYNAEGRAHTLDNSVDPSPCKRYSEAERLYQKAIVTLPDMIDSYVNLAFLYIKAKEGVTMDWKRKARESLDKAIELDANCTRARFLLAELKGTDEVGEYTAACEILNSINSLPEAQLLLANIHSNPRNPQRDSAAALAAWKAGVEMIDEPNRAQLEQLRVFKDRIFGSQENNATALSIFAAAAERLAKRGKCDGDKRLGSSWLEKLAERAQAA